MSLNLGLDKPQWATNSKMMFEKTISDEADPLIEHKFGGETDFN